jgi:hypothetical protein
MESAGTVAAPLLAGFSFTLLVLVVPTFSGERTVLTGRSGVKVVQQHDAFSGAPEVAALLLLLAGLLLVFSIQAAIYMRYHSQTPGELAEWYPQYFREAQSDGSEALDVPSDLKGWDLPDAPAMRVGGRWYGGLMRKYLYDEIVTANKWAKRMRNLYHGGILSLLSGLTVLVWPPAGQGTPSRVALAAVALVGTIAEAVWIGAASRETLKTLTGSLMPGRKLPRAATAPTPTSGDAPN